MSWNECTYITQSNFYSASQEDYQAAYSQCVGEIAMSGSTYITEVSESKLYINSGSQSGSLIYTSAPHGLEDTEEIGHYETGSFCHKCNSYFRHAGKENMLEVHTKFNIQIRFEDYAVSRSLGLISDKQEWGFINDDYSCPGREVVSGSNLNITHRFWTD